MQPIGTVNCFPRDYTHSSQFVQNRQLTHRQSKGEPLVPIVALSDISNNVCGVKVFVFERSGVNSEELF